MFWPELPAKYEVLFGLFDGVVLVITSLSYLLLSYSVRKLCWNMFFICNKLCYPYVTLFYKIFTYIPKIKYNMFHFRCFYGTSWEPEEIKPWSFRYIISFLKKSGIFKMFLKIVQFLTLFAFQKRKVIETLNPLCPISFFLNKLQWLTHCFQQLPILRCNSNLFIFWWIENSLYIIYTIKSGMFYLMHCRASILCSWLLCLSCFKTSQEATTEQMEYLFCKY